MPEPISWGDLSHDELLAVSDATFDALTADVAGLLLEGPVVIEPEQPRASLWLAIESELGWTHNASAASASSTSSADRPFTSRSRWSGRTAVITLVAAAVLLVLVPVGLSLRSRSEDPEVLAQADLEILDPAASSGHADLVAEGSGEAITLEVQATAPTDDYLEVWLLAFSDDGQLEDLRSLGRLDSDGHYEIPADVDRSRFNTVDISIEVNDGDATHSGRSILRGELTS